MIKLPRKSKKYNSAKEKGFTLIELLLVVLIIGILSGVLFSAINVKGLRMKSRDAQRIGDLKKVQTALELYFADYRGYPEQQSWTNINTSSSVIYTSLDGSYINELPKDPREGIDLDTGVSSCYGTAKYGYYYITSDCGDAGCLSGNYILGTIMEVSTSADDSKLSNLRNCSLISSCPTYPNCYAVQNPL